MTKTQQKLVRQGTVFVNSGGKAISAVLRIVLLLMAVLFEGISILFSRMEDAIASDLSETERANKRNEGLTLSTLSDERDMSHRQGGFATEPALLTGTSGGLTRRK